MLFLYLYFGHQLADYIFQPSKLVKWKKNSPWGIFAHSFVHFIIISLLAYLYTFSYKVLYLGLIIAISHFFIDSVKLNTNKKSQKNSKKIHYWLDQLAHISVLVLATLFVNCKGYFAVRDINWQNIFDAFYFNTFLITYISLAIFVTLTVEYSSFNENMIGENKKDKLDTSKMLKRLFIITLIYLIFFLSFTPGVGLFFSS